MAWNNMPTTRVILHAKDRRAAKGLMQFHVEGLSMDPTAGEPAALAVATAAMTDVAITGVECAATAVNDAPGTPGTGPFDRVADKIRLRWQAADGSRPTLDIPGIDETLLAADGITLDLTNATTVANLATLKAALKTATGAAMTVSRGGFRRRSPNVEQR